MRLKCWPWRHRWLETSRPIGTDGCPEPRQHCTRCPAARRWCGQHWHYGEEAS